MLNIIRALAITACFFWQNNANSQTFLPSVEASGLAGAWGLGLGIDNHLGEKLIVGSKVGGYEITRGTLTVLTVGAAAEVGTEGVGGNASVAYKHESSDFWMPVVALRRTLYLTPGKRGDASAIGAEFGFFSIWAGKKRGQSKYEDNSNLYISAELTFLGF